MAFVESHDQPGSRQEKWSREREMVKWQQMRWSQIEGHLLLLVQARAVDGVLRDDFVRWHPGPKLPVDAQSNQDREAA